MDQRNIFHQVFTVEVGIACGVFGVVVLGVLYAVVFRRARDGIVPSRRRKHTRLELTYLATLAVTWGALVGFTATANHRETAMADPPAMRVRVTGFRWCWKFSYPGRSVSTTATCNGGDLPTLVVPTGRPVRIELTSHDVIHSFWVPALRYKLDAFPHHGAADGARPQPFAAGPDLHLGKHKRVQEIARPEGAE